MAAIEKRGENSFRLTVSCGYDKDGKKLLKHKTINLSDIKPKKQPEEAQRQWILFKDEVEKGLYLDAGKITFEDFIQKWLKDYAESELAPKTLHRYKELLNSRIIPALGHIKLNKLQPTHLTEFYNNLRETGIRLDNKYTPKKDFINIITGLNLTSKDILLKSGIDDSTLKRIEHGGNVQASTANKICTSINVPISTLFEPIKQEKALSDRTILHHHRLISSILTCAVQWEFLLNNPATRVKAPKVEKKEARHFDIDKTEYILELLEDEPIKYKTMITLAIYGGMREGELAALEWPDIDFENYTIQIDKSLQHLPEKGTFIKSTKTENSRKISIPKSVIALLREYKLWQNGAKADLGDLWVDKNMVFTSENGDFIFPSTISKWFLNFIRKHNKSIMNDGTIPEKDKPNYLIPEVNFHGLRHTSATLLINQNTDISTVSKRLGHSRTSTTMDIYSHSLEKADEVAADKLDNLLNNKAKNNNTIKKGKDN